MHDPNKDAIYLTDFVVWRLTRPWWCEVLPLKSWKQWANEVYADALANPVQGQTRFSGPPLTVGRRYKLGASAHLHDNRITVHPDYRFRWVVLHEVAHMLTPHEAFHGPNFLQAYRDLVRRHADDAVCAQFDRYYKLFDWAA